MYYVGCDLHKESTWFYIMNESGKRITSESILNHPDELHKFFSKIPKPFILAVEATYNWYFFIDIAEQYAEEAYLANSYELKAFAKRHKKTDKIDSRLIADVLRKGYLPAVYIPDKEARTMKELLNYRMKIVQDRSRNIFRLKSLLDRWGFDSGGNYTTYKALRSIKLGDLKEDIEEIAQGYITRIASLTEKEYESTKAIREKVQQNNDILNLITIPGLDYFSAALIKTEIADIGRFKSFPRLCAYAGLAPRVYQSANKSIHGSLNVNRKKNLQWILLEVVYHFIKANPKHKKKHESITKRKGYNTAKVALARDMLKVIYHILKEKRPYYKNAKVRSRAA